MADLATILNDNRGLIEDYLVIGYARWDDLVSRVEALQRSSPSTTVDEGALTFVIACAYAMARAQGVSKLTVLLTGASHSAANPKIWLEVLPIPPRVGEGCTRADLTAGTICVRDGTRSGIQLAPAEQPWVCLCEAKWSTDISLRVANDDSRNQLARLIENALCFQGFGKYANPVYVTVIAPVGYGKDKPKLLSQKFAEYGADHVQLAADIAACQLRHRERRHWHYPTNIGERLKSLSLRWVTYGQLLESVPDSALAKPLSELWQRLS